MTLARGARQFVVHEALLMMVSVSGLYFSSLTPITNIGASGDGAEIMTYAFFDPKTVYIYSNGAVHYPLGTALDVGVGSLQSFENTSGFNNVVGTNLSPRDG